MSTCRDLKAENVLLHQQGHWVLCDFGSTTSFAGVYESTNAIMAAEEIIRKYTTPAYRAPEVIAIISIPFNQTVCWPVMFATWLLLL